MNAHWTFATELVLWIPMPLIIVITFLEFIKEIKNRSYKK